MTQFPWKIIRSGQEICFPEGARRFVSVSVEQIGGDGRLDRAIDASAIFLGDAAFRLHAVTLSCQGHTVAPVFDLWPSQVVTLECPVEFSVPGPSAVLAYDPVAGSVYGVDEDDNRLAATVVGRNVTSAGAVAIRFRPVMQCVVASRNADKTQNRADAGWTIRLEELGGDETGFGEGADTVVFASPGLQSYAVGSAFSLSLAASVTSSTGLPVVFTVLSGSLPAGLSMNSAGVISGTPTGYGEALVSSGDGNKKTIANGERVSVFSGQVWEDLTLPDSQSACAVLTEPVWCVATPVGQLLRYDFVLAALQAPIVVGPDGHPP